MTVLLLLLAAPIAAQQPDAVAVLLAREIAPYAAAVAELESQLRPRPVVRFFLDSKNRSYSLEARDISLDPQQFAAVVAIGPEALRYLSPRAQSTPLVFGMVLHPERIILPSQQALCGVDLTIPVAVQLAHIKQQFPDIQSLGVLFDPANNQPWFDQAQQVASTLGFEVVPLNVSRAQGRLEILGDFARTDAVLFIPDRTVIAQVVIQHVIKQALQRGKPAIGFNRFFLDSGAALAFLIDYQQVGRQVAELVQSSIDASSCNLVQLPVFDAVSNEQVLRLLGMDVSRGAP